MTTKFHIKAEENSPIWGSGNDIAEWLEKWHEEGRVFKGDTVYLAALEIQEAKEKRAELLRKIVEFRKNGYTYEKIRLIVGLPYSTLWKIAKDIGA